MAKKGLGSGLDALFGGDAERKEGAGLLNLPLSKVEPAADQPRERFEPEALEDLADSIRQHGVLQPIAVRALGGGYYQIIAGERRWRAAREAGLDTIPARVLEADDRAAKVLALVENLQRQDLNPVEQAKGLNSLMRDYGLTQEAAAEQVGFSRPAVANALRLLSLPEPVLAMLEEGSLTAGHARALLALGDEESICRAAELVVKEELSVRQTEELIRRKKASPKKKKESPRSIYVRDLEERLGSHWNRKVRIVEGKRRGKLEIEYYGNEDLDRLLAAMNASLPD
ncbi:MAG: ParB/RepB/Spo0J family partition protein [Oscillospiraceae bacterium]|nr:ParB/RepB/Spo0J family partition protein [Oscillospiraceae bacterium]